MPQKPFEIYEEDFAKTMMDYLLFKEGIDVREFEEKLLKKVLYSSNVKEKDNDIIISLGKEATKND